VGVDQAGDDGATLGVYRLGARRHREVAANNRDAVLLNEQVHITLNTVDVA